MIGILKIYYIWNCVTNYEIYIFSLGTKISCLNNNYSVLNQNRNWVLKMVNVSKCYMMGIFCWFIIMHQLNVMWTTVVASYNDGICINTIIINWWKVKPSEGIACTRKQQPLFYWSCSSVVMNDATPLTPPSAWAELHFQM